MAPCLFQIQTEVKRGNIDIHTGEGFQDVIAAVNFWSHLTRELLVKCLVQELDTSDYRVSKAGNNDTVTERVQKASDHGSWQEITKVTLAAEMLLNLCWSKMHRIELFSAAITVPMHGLALAIRHA